jgi:chromosome segregation ATPase
MCKKLFLIALVVVGGAALLNKTKAGSYVRTLFSNAEDSLAQAVPPEMEADRIRHEIGRLEKDIEKLQGKLANANVEARTMREDVEKDRRDLEAAESLVRQRGEELKKASQDQKFKWNGRTLSYDSAKQDLHNEVRRVKNLQDALESSEKTLEILERNRDLLDRQVETFRQQKREMHAAVKNLDALINLAKLEQMGSRHQNDGSRLADIKNSMRDLRQRIEVQREKLNLAKRFDQPEHDVTGKSVDEILGELKTPASSDRADARP